MAGIRSNAFNKSGVSGKLDMHDYRGVSGRFDMHDYRGVSGRFDMHDYRGVSGKLENHDDCGIQRNPENCGSCGDISDYTNLKKSGDQGFRGNYEALLAAVIIARATSLLIVKVSLSDFGIFNLMALRFGIASICMLPFVYRHRAGINKASVLHGLVLGSMFFIIIAMELLGLRMTSSSSMVSFIENTSIMIVPLASAFLNKKRPGARFVIAAVTAFAGVGFLLMKGGRIELSAGMLVCLGIAVLYSAYVIVTDRLSKQDDPLVLGAVQLGVVAVMSAVCMPLNGAPRMPANASEWLGIMLLAIICSSIGTALQPVAQSRISAEKSGIYCALNPLTACSLGWLFLGEWQGLSGLIGAMLILAAILIANSRTNPLTGVSALLVPFEKNIGKGLIGKLTFPHF